MSWDSSRDHINFNIMGKNNLVSKVNGKVTIPYSPQKMTKLIILSVCFLLLGTFLILLPVLKEIFTF
ncbi:MAG: hypothetical protein ACFFD1_15005 [Candidatus Thorarchaeota archaeon]